MDGVIFRVTITSRWTYYYQASFHSPPICSPNMGWLSSAFNISTVNVIICSPAKTYYCFSGPLRARAEKYWLSCGWAELSALCYSHSDSGWTEQNWTAQSQVLHKPAVINMFIFVVLGKSSSITASRVWWHDKETLSFILGHLHLEAGSNRLHGVLVQDV